VFAYLFEIFAKTSKKLAAQGNSGVNAPRSSWPLVLVAAFGGVLAVSEARAAPRQVGGRTLHVSPQPLPNIAADQQFRTISEAAAAVGAGDTVEIHDGLYRESVVVSKSGTRQRPITFQAAAGAHVVVTGADRLLDWTKEGAAEENIFSTPWPHEFVTFSPTRAHPPDDQHRLIGRAEQVHVNGFALRQVLTREQLGRGTFFVDEAAKRLYVWGNSNHDLTGDPGWSPSVEASTRAVLWNCTGAFVHLRGVRFRFAANHAHNPAVQFAGAANVVEDCVFERTNTTGAVFLNTDQVARRCTFQDNGQLGFAAVRAHRLLVSDCLVQNNDTKDFAQQWEAGGCKIVLSRGVVIEQSRFLNNHGPGIWFDIGNENCTVRNTLAAGNESAGIFYEVSYGLHVHDNVITGNGLTAIPQAWGIAAGVSISSSPDCVIERNLLVGNKEGVAFREQDRTTPRIDKAPGKPKNRSSTATSSCSGMCSRSTATRRRGAGSALAMSGTGRSRCGKSSTRIWVAKRLPPQAGVASIFRSPGLGCGCGGTCMLSPLARVASAGVCRGSSMSTMMVLTRSRRRSSGWDWNKAASSRH
jgi:hypothetical protein